MGMKFLSAVQTDLARLRVPFGKAGITNNLCPRTSTGGKNLHVTSNVAALC